MPRLGIDLNPQYATRSAHVESFTGRRVRRLQGIVDIDRRSSRPFYLELWFLRLASGLAGLAMVAMTIALWKLFHFSH
jgi:hypothetical protein